MQSGQGKTKHWLLDFAPATSRDIDPLMGWTSSKDTQTQVKMTFDSKEQAIAYAEEHGIDYVVQEPKDPCPQHPPRAAMAKTSQPTDGCPGPIDPV